MAITIGGLNVMLGMDAADLNATARQVQTTLDKLAARFTFIANVITGVMDSAANAIGDSLGAIPLGIRKAIDGLDKLDETAQKVGLSVEHLDRFKFIAEATGLTMESFESIASKLAKTMSEIAGGDKSSDAALAFEAIGVSVKDASGGLKAIDVLLADVAERFAGYADGAEKTALAVQLFGKSGAALIPTLNEGRDGLQTLALEYAKLPPVSAETARAAAHFNDTLVKLTNAVDRGFHNAVVAVLPVLQSWADWLNEDHRLLTAVDKAATAFVSTAVEISTRIGTLAGNIAAVTAELAKLLPILDLAKLAMAGFGGVIDDVSRKMNAILTVSRTLLGELNRIIEAQTSISAVTASGAQGARGASELQGFEPQPDDALPAAPVTGGAKGVAEARKAEAEATRLQREAQAAHNAELQRFNELRTEGKRIYEETLGPLEQLALAQERMNEVNRKGGLLAHEYAAAQQRATLLSLNAYAGMASQIAGNLSKLFGESKAFAIAQAVINTAEAVTKTLATYGATPWGIALAASAAAAGAAQIAAIRSANKGGGGGGGGSAASSVASAAGGAASAPQQQQAMHINLQGDNFSGDGIRNLIGQINEAQRDGIRLLVTQS